MLLCWVGGTGVWGFVLKHSFSSWDLDGSSLLWVASNHLVPECPNPVSLDATSRIIPANLGFVSCRCVGMLSAWLSTVLSKTDPCLVLETGMGNFCPKISPKEGDPVLALSVQMLLAPMD